ncbi:MAG: zinc-binding dehydrogenase [Spirochaetota bacterium]
MSNLQKFKELNYKIPTKSRAWRLYGKGMESFGDNKQPTSIPVKEPNDDEILVRSDAVGLCFSDTKIIKFGQDHPRLQGRNLNSQPVIPGHEVSLTVVKAGKNRRNEYRAGERYIIQADAYYKGRGVAYGYIIPGGLSQYGILGKEILDGDHGSYLIPIRKKQSSYSEAALVEPWACVVASYRIKHRKSIKNGGSLLIIDQNKSGRHWSFSELFRKNTPASIIAVGPGRETKETVESCIPSNKINIVEENTWNVHELSRKHTGEEGFDDIIILGESPSPVISSAADNLAKYGILNYMADDPKKQVVDIDAGKIHYDRISFVGSMDNDVASSYTKNLDYSVKGPSEILFGAGGPMGQMHVQLALEEENPPQTIVATDISEERTQVLKENFTGPARKKGVNFYAINPNNFTDKQSYIRELFNINGDSPYDYVVCLAAIPAVIEEASSFLGRNAVLNVFAGVSKGTIVKLNIKEVASKSVRFIGSSGSTIEDMEYTLRKVEEGKLNTNSSVAGVAGMREVWKGLEAVKNGTFAGKILVYPHIKDLELMDLSQLKEKYPEIGRSLSSDGKWTREAEAALLERFLEVK